MMDLAIMVPKILFARRNSEPPLIDPEKANIIIMMDDGWESEYKIGYKIMNEKNMPGTIAVVANRVGTAQFMNYAQLLFLYESGWDLVNHTGEHKDLAEIDRDAQEKQIAGGLKWLKKHGFTRGMDILAYPYGNFNDDTIDLLGQYNIRSARTTHMGLNREGETDFARVKSFVVMSDDTVREVQDAIDEAVHCGGTLILVFHKLGDGDEFSYAPASFKELIDNLDAIRDDVNIITYTQWLDSMEMK